jgi:hypothetical protein
VGIQDTVAFEKATFNLSPNFSTFKEPKNRLQGTSSARLCSLAGRYDNPLPTLFLTPIDCLKIPALKAVCIGGYEYVQYYTSYVNIQIGIL